MTYSQKSKKDNYIGKTFGRLVPIKLVGRTKPSPKNRTFRLYECICACGAIKNVNAHDLCGGTKSCGCLTKTGYKEIPGTYLSSLRKNARKRNIEYSIDAKYLYNLWIKQNRKCAISGITLVFPKTSSSFDGTTSLDRIDSSKGYVKGNVQWVHKDINTMKWHYDQAYFIEMCKIIANFKS